jgi:LysM repeat protein
MTTRSLTLVQAVFIAFLISLAPYTAWSQQQEQPNVPLPEKAVGEPSPQAPAETAPGQQGAVIIPKQGKQAPEKSEASPQEETPKEERSYTIKQGDTLWDISNTFLKDPFLWPFIWKANQYITNPDLIYPGNKLVIPSLAPIEQALQAPAEKEQLVEKPTTTAQAPTAEEQPQPVEEAKTPESRLLLPEEKPVPIIDKYSMLRAGFVDFEESKDVIIGLQEEKTIAAYDDIVYVDINSKKDAAVGDKFMIYNLRTAVKHPITGKDYGSLVKVLGVLQLTEKGRSPGIYAARITLSFNDIEKGDKLTFYKEPTLIFNTAQEKPKDISGYILAVMDGRTINAQTDIVYLDKGVEDGVEPGDRFVIYAKLKNKKYPKYVLGEAQVFLVKDHTSTAVVIKSSNVIARGNEVVYKK